MKGQHAPLYRRLKKLPWAQIPAVSTVATGRGRGPGAIKVASAPAWIEFTGAAQIAQLRRTVTQGGKKTIEVVYLVTSMMPRPPPRRHWRHG